MGPEQSNARGWEESLSLIAQKLGEVVDALQGSSASAPPEDPRDRIAKEHDDASWPVVDAANKQIRFRGKRVRGGPVKSRLLKTLCEAHGELVQLSRLIDAAWSGHERPTNARALLHTHISQINDKLWTTFDGELRIENSRDEGYRLISSVS